MDVSIQLGYRGEKLLDTLSYTRTVRSLSLLRLCSAIAGHCDCRCRCSECMRSSRVVSRGECVCVCAVRRRARRTRQPCLVPGRERGRHGHHHRQLGQLPQGLELSLIPSQKPDRRAHHQHASNPLHSHLCSTFFVPSSSSPPVPVPAHCPLAH